jgi:hypothetical protein
MSPPKLLRFPLEIKDASMWVKYEIMKVVQGDTNELSLRPKPSTNVMTTIALSLPSEGLSVSNNQTWSTEEAGGMDSLKMMTKQPTTAVTNKGIKEGITDALGEAFNKIAQTSGSTRAVVDKMALNYKGPEIRTFEMSHIMVPRNKIETDAIKNIVKAFRMATSPEIISSSFGITYNLPEFFKVTYMSGSEAATGFPQYAGCYCSSVDAKYSRSTFQDDHPTSVELTMSFTELDPMGSEKIQEGF